VLDCICMLQSMTRPCIGMIKRAHNGATSDPLGQVAAELLAASAESDMDARMDIDGEAGGGGGGGELRPRLLHELGVILAPAGRERGGARPGPAPDPALTAAALDAAGALGATRGGAELLLADEALASALAALALQGTGADLFGRTMFLTIIIALQTRMPAAAYNRGGACSPYTKPVLTQS